MHLVRRSSARTTLTLPNAALTLTSDAATDIRHRMRSCQAAAAPRLLVFGVPLMPQIAVAPLPPLPLLLSLPCAVAAVVPLLLSLCRATVLTAARFSIYLSRVGLGAAVRALRRVQSYHRELRAHTTTSQHTRQHRSRARARLLALSV